MVSSTTGSYRSTAKHIRGSYGDIFTLAREVRSQVARLIVGHLGTMKGLNDVTLTYVIDIALGHATHRARFRASLADMTRLPTMEHWTLRRPTDK